jgi:hypothetical protein
MGRNNKKAGNKYELDILKELQELGFDNLKSSRNESRTADAKGQDIVSTSESVNKLWFAPQCKTYSKSPNYPQLFTTYTTDLPLVIFHKFTKKATKNFVEAGQYIILEKELFYQLLKQLHNNV